MAFFNQTTPLITLQDTWTQRKIERVWTHADMLYDILENDILHRRRHTLYRSLLEMADNADRPSDLSVTLWSYNNAYVSKCPKPFDYLKAQNKIVTEGLAWSVGRTTRCQAPTTLDDWEWTQRPMPIDEVVRNSDILERLGALFGNCFVVKVVRVNLGDIHMGGADDPVISRRLCRLELCYFPQGVHQHILERRSAVLAMHPPSMGFGGQRDGPFIWTGLMPVIYSVPALAPSTPRSSTGGYDDVPGLVPSTPPPAPPPTAPPPIRSKSVDHSVHYYGEGMSAIRAAARDSIASVLADVNGRARPPCHCCYNDDDEERYNEDDDIHIE